MPTENTFASEAIAIGGYNNACDRACKKVLALKEIASRILKGVAYEYRDCTIDEVIRYISDIEISDTPVDVDVLPPVVHTDNSEDTTASEGARFFDIRFTAKAPGRNGQTIELIINIEAQKNYDPGYSLLKRGIYYCSRLISSQYGQVFSGSDYDRLRKVYSVWICTDPDEAHRNTITEYSLSPKQHYGDIRFKSEEDRECERQNYDMISLVMICLDNFRNGVSSENSLIKLLSVLLSPKIEIGTKKIILQSDYDIKMTREVNEEVQGMCNISQGFIEMGIEEGREQGRELGREEGIEEGIEIGGERNMINIISTMSNDGRTDKEISEILHIPEEQVKKLKEKINK